MAGTSTTGPWDTTMGHANEPHASAFYQNMLIFSQQVRMVCGNM
jgi:hypothetical protein